MTVTVTNYLGLIYTPVAAGAIDRAGVANISYLIGIPEWCGGTNLYPIVPLHINYHQFC